MAVGRAPVCSAHRDAHARVFFALWPDEAVRRSLDKLGRALHGQLGGRLMAAPMLHLTLAFIGAFPRAALGCLQAAALEVKTGPFDLVLDCVGHWRRNGIVWAGIRQPVAQLEVLVERLQVALRVVSVKLEQGDFQAHVTLLRKVVSVSGAMADEVLPLTVPLWPVHEFVLVESCRLPSGPSYRLLARWPLRGA